MPTIDYYFAPHSPFVYLGHQRFCDLARRSKATVRVKPCDLARIFSVSGGLPLAKRATQRQSYRLIELQRFSAALGVPLNLHPKYFPVSGDPAARLILAALEASELGTVMELIGAVGRAVWVEDRDIADPKTLEELANGVTLPGRRLLERSQTDEIEDAYQRTTDEAIAAEVFGAPTYVLNGERYWGQDRLTLMESTLLGLPL
ncbi:MAG: 2-hydroxychromene-2-carboxylate isomerase [Burkholderiaceae bacterium]|jgi:2-hydroxychromene-2-carboxylate isomerase